MLGVQVSFTECLAGWLVGGSFEDPLAEVAAGFDEFVSPMHPEVERARASNETRMSSELGLGVMEFELAELLRSYCRGSPSSHEGVIGILLDEGYRNYCT